MPDVEPPPEKGLLDRCPKCNCGEQDSGAAVGEWRIMPAWTRAGPAPVPECSRYSCSPVPPWWLIRYIPLPLPLSSTVSLKRGTPLSYPNGKPELFTPAAPLVGPDSGPWAPLDTPLLGVILGAGKNPPAPPASCLASKDSMLPAGESMGELVWELRRCFCPGVPPLRGVAGPGFGGVADAMVVTWITGREDRRMQPLCLCFCSSRCAVRAGASREEGRAAPPGGLPTAAVAPSPAAAPRPAAPTMAMPCGCMCGLPANP
mmetsp:Transcript_10918/g.23549  ORF Transcript_10918/g.23549 Transcript_10918/m.23549 type:complete len:260 (-) Transcript_10918:432-1211(-)